MESVQSKPKYNYQKDVYRFSEMTESERSFTANIIAKYKPKNLLEVGVSAGGGTVVLLDAIKKLPSASVTSVEFSESWYMNPDMPAGWLAHHAYSGNIPWTLHKGVDFSEIADRFTEKFDFLLLDTAHVHPCESLNFLTILPYLTGDAVVVLHDIGLYTHVNSVDGNACKLLFDTVTAEKIECFDYEYKLAAHTQKRALYVPNIGAFQVSSDTRKYIRDVFSMLRYSWGFHMEKLGSIRKILEKNYDGECLRLFEAAVALNLSYLFCGKRYDFSSINNCLCKIQSGKENIQKALEKYDRIIFHGAGELCPVLLDLFAALGCRMPTEIWDVNPQKARVKDFSVTKPEYNQLNENDLVIVTIANYITAHAISAKALVTKCSGIFAVHELAERLCAVTPEKERIAK